MILGNNKLSTVGIFVIEPSLAEQSFHASLFEEEWKKRTSVVFDIEEDDPQVVGFLLLLNC